MESRVENWDLSKAEIDSIASDDLHERRPNRWTGPKSTWRYWTEEERFLWQSMRRLEDQDLGVHLYNAHALKRMGQNPVTAPDVTITSEQGIEAVWAPPRSWTAWPLSLEQLPYEPFVERRAEDDENDDSFTFRRREVKYPSTELGEEVTAAILRVAKARFHKREQRLRRKASNVRPSVEQPLQLENISLRPAQTGIQSNEELGDESRDEDVRSRVGGKDDDDDDEEEHKPRVEAGMVSGQQTWHTEAGQAGSSEPAVSTNDELSSKILGPSVRHILSRLDQTLLIMHTLRASTVNYNSESSTNTSDSESQAETPRKPRSRARSKQPAPSGGEASGGEYEEKPQKRAQGRPRKGSKPGDTMVPVEAPPKKSRRGRPKKVQVPRDGETKLQMMERVARESHRKLPDFIAASNASDKEAAFEAWFSKGEEDFQRRKSLDGVTDTEAPTDREGEGRKRRGVQKLGLRDWSDVLGAAALAGFSPEVISRTAKRCATLFNESIVTRTLHEVPLSQGTGVQTTTHIPTHTQSPDPFDHSTSEDESQSLLQRRIASRQSSLAKTTSLSPGSSPTGTPRRIRSSTPGARASRSPSASSMSQQHFCPVVECDRAARGFTRRANLKRHMDLVHPGREADGDVDSDEEVVGGVHVDGFLRPINVGRGWRGDDMVRRKKRGLLGPKRAEREMSEDEEDDVELSA